MFDPDFDGHKLMYHPERVAEWVRTGRTGGPLYTEFELTNACNCRCVFCGVDHLVNRDPAYVDPAVARKGVDGLAAIGNRAILFSGHGEPLLHPEAPAIVAYAATKMSAALTTNGLLLDETRLPLIDGLAWVRFSINGYGAKGYAAIHGTTQNGYDRVVGNLAAAAERKRRLGLATTIGTQLVLLPENADQVVPLARAMREAGADYFSVKPFSQHPLAKTRLRIDYEPLVGLEGDLRRLETDAFRVGFRARSMLDAGRPKPYRACAGTHFLSFVDARGKVWECNVYAGDPRFLVGDLAEDTMEGIWNGERRAEVLAYIDRELNIDRCRDLCRMDRCNRYLWRLRNPWPHDDFI